MRQRRSGGATVAAVAALLTLAACSQPSAPDRFGQALDTLPGPVTGLQFVDLEQVQTVLAEGTPGPDDAGLMNLAMPAFTVVPDSTLQQAGWALATTSGQTRIAGAAGTEDDFEVIDAGAELEVDGEDLVITPDQAPQPSGTAPDPGIDSLRECLGDPDVGTAFVLPEDTRELDGLVTAVGLGSTLTSRSQGEHRACLLLQDGADPGLVTDAVRGARPRQAPEPTFTAGQIIPEGGLVRVDLEADGSDAVAAAARLHQHAPEAQAPWF